MKAVDIERAKTLRIGFTPLSARDAVHVAVMQRYDIPRIMSFHAGFNQKPDLDSVCQVANPSCTATARCRSFSVMKVSSRGSGAR